MLEFNLPSDEDLYHFNMAKVKLESTSVETIRSIESRLAEIEAKLTFAEDLLEELNRTVYRQQQQIDRLQQELRALRETLDTAGPAEPIPPGDEVPPHY